MIPGVDIWGTRTLNKIISKAKKAKYFLLFGIIIIIVLKANLYIANGS